MALLSVIRRWHFRSGIAVREMSGGLCRLHLLKRPGGDREMVEILALVLHHDERKVEEAVTLALR